jgi:lysozyme
MLPDLRNVTRIHQERSLTSAASDDRLLRQRRRFLLGAAALAGGAGLVGALAYKGGAVAPWLYEVIGVDVSNHQGGIDWPLLARTDIEFAYIKATEGGDFQDRCFQANWDGARAAGLARGAYHFFTQCRPGAEQARNFMRVVPREPGALPPVLDVEHWGPCRTGPRSADLAGEIATALDMLATHYGRRPLLYTDAEFDAAYLRDRFADETFWARAMFLPPGFRTSRWLIWQYDNRGRRAGVTGPVDLNVFRGSRQEFAAFTAGPSDGSG